MKYPKFQFEIKRQPLIKIRWNLLCEFIDNMLLGYDRKKNVFVGTLWPSRTPKLIFWPLGENFWTGTKQNSRIEVSLANELRRYLKWFQKL